LLSLKDTLQARQAWAGLSAEQIKSYGGPTPQGAIDLAAAIGKTLEATWTIGETGVAGPSKAYAGNRNLDAGRLTRKGGRAVFDVSVSSPFSSYIFAGFVCFGVVGPVTKGIEFSTGESARDKNMILFAKRGLELLAECLDEADKK
jgi:nicotinamide mononucleotide (NMN) deamidase PncC